MKQRFLMKIEKRGIFYLRKGSYFAHHINILFSQKDIKNLEKALTETEIHRTRDKVLWFACGSWRIYATGVHLRFHGKIRAKRKERKTRRKLTLSPLLTEIHIFTSVCWILTFKYPLLIKEWNTETCLNTENSFKNHNWRQIDRTIILLIKLQRESRSQIRLLPDLFD